MAEIPSGKVPVVAVVTASWRFLAGNWPLLLPAAIITALLSSIVPLFVTSAMGITPAAVLVIAIIQQLAAVSYCAVILRKAARAEFKAPVGLSFGPDETRLLGVFGALLLIGLALLFVFSVVIAAFAVAQAGLSDTEAEELAKTPEALNQILLNAMNSTSGLIVRAITITAAVLLAARLCIAGAATIGERKIVIFQTWSWSKGNVLRIVAAMLLTGLPFMAAMIFLPLAVSALIPDAASLLLRALAAIVLYLIGNLALIPPVVLTAELYRGLKPPGFVAK